MRYLATVLVAGLLCCSILLVRVSPANASGPTHGCAPSIPPAVSGSPAPAPATVGIVRINEVLTKPGSVWNCSDIISSSYAGDSWVELYNPQSQPYNLYTGHALLDSGYGTNAYYFPLNASIAAHGFLVLFPFASLEQTSYTSSTLRLVIGGAITDQITLPQLDPDQSYARTADGGGKWFATYFPTIDASNTTGMITPTPIPTATTGSSGSPGSTTGNTGSGYSSTSSSSTKLVSGTQPRWGTLNLPTTATATLATPSTINNTPATNTTLLSSPAPATSTGLDATRRIIITLLLIALAATLFWCWRLFSSP